MICPYCKTDKLKYTTSQLWLICDDCGCKVKPEELKMDLEQQRDLLKKTLVDILEHSYRIYDERNKSSDFFQYPQKIRAAAEHVLFTIDRHIPKQKRREVSMYDIEPRHRMSDEEMDIALDNRDRARDINRSR